MALNRHTQVTESVVIESLPCQQQMLEGHSAANDNVIVVMWAIVNEFIYFCTL